MRYTRWAEILETCLLRSLRTSEVFNPSTPALRRSSAQPGRVGGGFGFWFLGSDHNFAAKRSAAPQGDPKARGICAPTPKTPAPDSASFLCRPSAHPVRADPSTGSGQGTQAYRSPRAQPFGLVQPLSDRTGLCKIFIPVQMCRTFSASPINMRLSEEFDAQIKLQRPD